MGVVTWRAARHNDRAAISLFECADPPKPTKSAATGYKPHHPRIWELEAQQWIRSLAPKVPCAGPLRVYVAEDQIGLVAVASWVEVGGPAEVHVDVVGLALRLRYQGGSLVRAIADVALREIEAAAIDAGADELYIEGEIFHENGASLRLTKDQHFSKLVEHPGGAQTWSLRVPLDLSHLQTDDEPA